jgi:hypothetical protein
VLWLGLLSLALALFGATWGIRQEYIVTASAIQAAGDFAYAVAVPPPVNSFLKIQGDDADHARRSSTTLFEDGRRLGPPHRPHEYIHHDGHGQFSHWISTLYFSTSDNSDPRTNGRRYTLVAVARLPGWPPALWMLLVLGSAIVALWGGRRARGVSRSSPVGWIVAGTSLAIAIYAALLWSSFDPASWGAARGTGLRVLWIASLFVSGGFACFTGVALSTLDRSSLTATRRWLTTISLRVARPFERRGWRGAIWRTASLAIPLTAFMLPLRYPYPPRVLVDSYLSVLPIGAAAGVALWCCHLRRDWLGTLASLTVTLALFALPLAALWQHFGIHYNAIGGLLPFADASGYYYDARRLIDGHPFGWSARRPAFVGLLSTLLTVTGDNLIVCVALFVALNGVATFLLARQLRITHGPAAAAVVTVVLFLFYRVEGGLGTVLTENLGFAMGVVAFAILWRGLRENDVRRLWLGLGVLTLALMSRAGAFLVLPALVIAVVWGFRQNRQWVRAGLGAVAAVALAATLTLGLGRILSDPASSQRALSNFSYVLYGLVVGGRGWSQVTIDHPDATEGVEIYSLAWQAFQSRPAGIVEGSLRMWAAYLSPWEPYHAFAFVRDATYGRYLQLACYALCGLGLVVSVVRYRQPLYACLVAGIAAHVASIPFVPPIDAGLRVYAATIPILALLVSLGAAEVLRWGSRVPGLSRLLSRPEASAEQPTSSAPSPELFGVALALIVFIGPVYVFYSGREPAVEAATCVDAAPPLHVRYAPGSYLRILSRIPDVNDTRVRVPEVQEAQLRQTAGVIELKNEAGHFTVGNTIVDSYDVKNGRRVWLVAPTARLPQPPAILAVCGHYGTDATAKQYGVFYADSVQSGKDGSRLP